jgi:hypothetical protein
MSVWNFFKRKPQDLFLEFNPLGSQWRVVTWNFDLDSPEKRQRTVEIQGPINKLIQLVKAKRERLAFFENDKLIEQFQFKGPRQDLLDLMNLSIHSTIKYSIEQNHEFMLTPVSGATTLDIQAEARALQWVQASFGTLTRALESMRGKSDLILTAAFFSGIAPEGQERVLRLIAFNLDIFYYLRSDHSLQIVVFDDKNLGQGSSKRPSFQQIIKVTKPQFYDEMIRILHLLAQTGETV